MFRNLANQTKDLSTASVSAKMVSLDPFNYVGLFLNVLLINSGRCLLANANLGSSKTTKTNVSLRASALPMKYCSMGIVNAGEITTEITRMHA